MQFFPLLLGEGRGEVFLIHKHLPNYTKSSIPNARRLCRDMTIAEQRVWSKLKNDQLGVKFRRQVPYGRYILDFYCAKAKLCVELDGSQHYTNEGIQKDLARDRYLQEQGIEVLHFSDIDTLKNTSGVMQAIYEKIQERLQHETPS
jgi:very-short-patch-repair endonuclease